jgi:leucyl/phenylalanyl-tRNA---protein transferase
MMMSEDDDLTELDPATLVRAYMAGAFPMAMEDGSVDWFSPDPRGIIPIKEFHVPHGLARALRRGAFEVRIDTAFATVMRGCADRESTWISAAIFKSYVKLYELGLAHSVEAWQDDRLVGGLYGVALGGAFFGESMFSRVAEASKVALHALVTRLGERGYVLLDTQWVTPHLRQFGAHEIARDEYLFRLDGALQRECQFV